MRLRRVLATVLLGAAIAALSFAPAQAFTVTGGTEEQRADVVSTIDAIQFPSVAWVESKVGPVRVEILDHYEPYWVVALGDTARVDVFSATAAGVASPGSIRIAASYTPGESTFFREIVAHEFAHQVWFALLHVSGASKEWRQMVEAGLTPDPSDWYQNYVESHAEQLRVAAWAPAYYMTVSPRTELNLLGNDAVRDFHARWTSTTTTTTAPPPPPTTTTTLPRGDPWPDVAREDTELWAAAWWARDAGLFLGYANGTFGPYDPLTRHQVALIVDRWVQIALPEFLWDYSLATRADVWEAFPGLRWDSERWAEPVLRSQLLRLMWRAQ